MEVIFRMPHNVRTKKDKIRIEDYTGIKSVMDTALSLIPSAMTVNQLKEQYNVCIEEYGYVHDTGFAVYLTARTDLADEDAPLQGHGWETFEEEYKREVEFFSMKWGFSIEYGYH